MTLARPYRKPGTLPRGWNRKGTGRKSNFGRKAGARTSLAIAYETQDDARDPWGPNARRIAYERIFNEIMREW